MKQVVSALLFAASVQSQGPPPVVQGTTAPPVVIIDPNAPVAPATTAAAAPVAPGTTAAATPVAPATTAAAAPVAPGTTAAPLAPATTAAAPVAPATTAATAPVAPATTAAAVPVAPATTAAPVAPVTTAAAPLPTTPAPTPYVNPYCPAGKVLEVLGAPSNPTLPLGFRLDHQAECRSNIPGDPRSIARDFEGRLICDSWACCLCQEITCGGSGYPCEQIKISDKGAIGVQNINVVGQTAVASLYGAWSQGAQIDCSGYEACKRANVRGSFVRKMQCTGDYGCEASNIRLEAAQEMDFQCNGLFGCANSVIEIVVTAASMISEIGTIEFNGQQSAQGATLRLISESAQPVMIRNLECMNPTACPNLIIELQGNFWIENCDLQGMQNLHTLPALVQQCALGQSGNFQSMPYYPMPIQPAAPLPAQPAPAQPAPLPVQPATPAQPLPVQPATPAQPLPVQPATPAQPLPAQPLPAQPATPTQPAQPTGPVAPATPAQQPLMSLSSQSLKCMMAQCANRQIQVVPTNNFILECLGNCQNMDLIINAGFDPMNMGQYVERIDAIKFITPNSGRNAKITINTAPGMYQLEVNDIRCEGIGSCAGLSVTLGAGVDPTQFQMDCQHFGSCAGCTVTQNGMTQPCELYTGNNNGFFGIPPQTPGAYNPGYSPNPVPPVTLPAPQQAYPYGQYGQYGPYPYYPWL